MTDEQFRARAIAEFEARAERMSRVSFKRSDAFRRNQSEINGIGIAIQIIRDLPCDEPTDAEVADLARKHFYVPAPPGAFKPAPAAQGEDYAATTSQWKTLNLSINRIAALEKRQAETEAIVRDLLCLLMSHEKNEAYFYDFQQLAVAAKIAVGGGR